MTRIGMSERCRAPYFLQHLAAELKQKYRSDVGGLLLYDEHILNVQ